MKHLIPIIIFLTTPLAGASQDIEWHRFAPDECEAEVSFPGQPELTVQAIEGSDAVIHQHIFDVWHEMVMFSFNCSDPVFDTGAMHEDQKYEILIQSARQRVGDPNIEIDQLRIDGHPAIDFIQPLVGSSLIYNRAVIANGRIYQLSVGDMNGTAEDSAYRFLESFLPNQ